jgi:hypothetical protein
VPADSYLLGQLLTIAALIGATIEYAEIIKRRGIARRADAIREENADLGLRGLVRVLLVEQGEQG